MLRLVIFDFDGVIADSEPAHFEMFRQICLEEGLDFTWESYKEKYLGYTDTECFREFLISLGQEPTTEKVKELVERKSVKFARYIEENCVILPGVPELLEDLKRNEILCSICSGALRSEIESMLGQGGLSDYFNIIVAAEDVARGKPYPDGFLLNLERVNGATGVDEQLLTEHCLVIEDSVWGIQAAQRANMRCLGVATTYPAEQIKNADMVIPDLTHTNAGHLRSLMSSH